MSTLINLSLLTLGWCVGYLFGHVAFNGLSCSTGYSLIAGWGGALYLTQYRRPSFLEIGCSAIAFLLLSSVLLYFISHYALEAFDNIDILEIIFMSFKYTIFFESPQIVDRLLNYLISNLSPRYFAINSIAERLHSGLFGRKPKP